MIEPIIQPQARADLREIMAFLARRNRDLARKTRDMIMERVRLQALSPLAGRSRDDILPELRTVAVGSYVVFFRPIEDTIEVLRILHGSRNHAKIIREETEL